MVSYLVYSATIINYFVSTGYEKEAQKVEKNYQFTQTARGEDKESKFKVATGSKYVIISLLNQDVINLGY